MKTARRLLNIITSRHQQHRWQKELVKVSVDVAHLFDETRLLLGNRMELQGIILETSVQEGLPGLHGDRDQIKQGLMNLLLNSMDAMPSGKAGGVLSTTSPHLR